MTVLNLADALKVGGSNVDRVYAGADLVWPTGSTPATYDDEVLADTPLAYWRLDETSGTTMLDSSGNGRHGVIDAGVTVGATGVVPGITGTAWQLNAAEGGQVTDASWMTPAAGLTAEAWVKLTSLPGEAVLMARSFVGGTNNTTNKAWSIQITTSGQVVGRIYSATSATAVPASASGKIQVGVLHHVVLTQTSTTVAFFVDGVQIASASLNGGPVANARPITVGRQAVASTYALHGTVQAAAFYGTALSPTRIAAHHAAGIAA